MNDHKNLCKERIHLDSFDILHRIQSLPCEIHQKILSYLYFSNAYDKIKKITLNHNLIMNHKEYIYKYLVSCYSISFLYKCLLRWIEKVRESDIVNREWLKDTPNYEYELANPMEMNSFIQRKMAQLNYFETSQYYKFVNTTFI